MRPTEPQGGQPDERVVVVTSRVVKCCAAAVVPFAVEFDHECVLLIPGVTAMCRAGMSLPSGSGQTVRAFDIDEKATLQRAMRAGVHIVQHVTEQRPVTQPRAAMHLGEQFLGRRSTARDRVGEHGSHVVFVTLSAEIDNRCLVPRASRFATAGSSTSNEQPTVPRRQLTIGVDRDHVGRLAHQLLQVASSRPTQHGRRPADQQAGPGSAHPTRLAAPQIDSRCQNREQPARQ